MIKLHQEIYAPFLEGLKSLFESMDQKYNEAAAYYGFHCSGCEDNCCLTRFYHHTFLEYLYLLKGFDGLSHEKKAEIKDRAESVCRETAQADKNREKIRIMCPLNAEGLCSLYEYRPMICRLHGLPHELRRPGQNAVYSPGCEAFTAQCGDKTYFQFDRTPFYIDMAKLEAELKQAIGTGQKVRMTVAEMLNR